MSEYDLDLDALAPSDIKIKINGSVITVEVPDVEDLFGLLGMSKRLTEAKDLNPDELAPLLKELSAETNKLVPALKDQKLSVTQLIAIIGVIIERVTPPDAKELKKQGITFGSDSGSPKDQSGSLDSSVTSSDSTQPTPEPQPLPNPPSPS